jgi:hypothetical protein
LVICWNANAQGWNDTLPFQGEGAFLIVRGCAGFP